MSGKVSRSCADDELQREKLSCDYVVGRRCADAEAYVDTVLHPVADPVVELHVGLNLRITTAEGVEQWPQHWGKDRQQANDTQRPPDALPGLARRLERPLHAQQGWQRHLQEVPALNANCHAA